MLDATQTIVKNKLGLNYSQINGYKIIYDFICKFAFCQSASNNIYAIDYQIQDIKLADGAILNSIPHRTREIVNAIGTHSLHIYFSPHAYKTKFLNFCEKMRAARAQMRDYVVTGCLVQTKGAFEVEYDMGAAS